MPTRTSHAHKQSRRTSTGMPVHTRHMHVDDLASHIRDCIYTNMHKPTRKYVVHICTVIRVQHKRTPTWVIIHRCALTAPCKHASTHRCTLATYTIATHGYANLEARADVLVHAYLTRIHAPRCVCRTCTSSTQHSCIPTPRCICPNSPKRMRHVRIYMCVYACSCQ